MHYNITQQFASDDERFIAQLADLFDAALFMKAKMAADTSLNLIVIYRLYNQDQLMKEFNKEKITIPIFPADFADRGRILPDTLPHGVNVFQSLLDVRQSALIAAFSTLSDARLFIHAKLAQDAHENKNIAYRFFEGDTFIERWGQENSIGKNQQDEMSSSKAMAFCPTPLEMTPRPPGTPAQWVRDKPDDDND